MTQGRTADMSDAPRLLSVVSPHLIVRSHARLTPILPQLTTLGPFRQTTYIHAETLPISFFSCHFLLPRSVSVCTSPLPQLKPAHEAGRALQIETLAFDDPAAQMHLMSV